MSDDWLELVTELLEAASERGDVDYLEVVKGDLQIRFGRGGATRERSERCRLNQRLQGLWPQRWHRPLLLNPRRAFLSR